ncbi:MAG: hypothetical protein L3K14_08500 [Thermoplasmata archaeon]|nr:hypothetical protein [Thermoplasmata archaeon]
MAGRTWAVRIRRDENVPGDSGAASEPADRAPSTPPSGRRVSNSAGSSRAFRTFLLFVVALGAIYGVFLAYSATSSVTGGSPSVAGILTGSVVVALVVGWWVTLGQTPTVAWLERGELVVRERTGRLRRFPRDDLRIHVLRTNGGGFLGPTPTEFVEVATIGGARRTYLVGIHFFDFAH